jgi:energy-coupling factor transporter ATP-binding protein EcfA2
MSPHVGFVFQDPATQFVAERVEDEIAFALENAAVPRAAMRARVDDVLDLVQLAPLRRRPLETLSGGERQRVAIASALALQPQILVLDEPTSQLDPAAAEDILRALVRLNAKHGLTILLAEHRLERVLPFADQLIYLPGDGGDVVAGPPRRVLSRMQLIPPVVAIGRALGWEPLPLSVSEGRRQARVWQRQNGAPRRRRPVQRSEPQVAEPYVRIRDLTVAYNGRLALREVDLDIWPKQITVIMGRNGTGKTTLLRSIVGLIQPARGQIHVAGRNVADQRVAELCRSVGYLPQDPNALLFADTVLDELALTLRNHGLWPPNGRRNGAVNPEGLLRRLGLADKAAAYPRDLSAGERQRVALGAVTVTHPGALLLDEPTLGLDYGAKEALVELLRGWRDDGMAIVLVTHDVELAAVAADRVVLMEGGRIVEAGPPAEVLTHWPRFSPQVARLFPGTGWLTPADALAAGNGVRRSASALR